MTLLIIGGWASKCGNCSWSNVNLMDTHHNENIGLNPENMPDPCGEKYTHVISEYVNSEEIVKGMRPDLIWSGK